MKWTESNTPDSGEFADWLNRYEDWPFVAGRCRQNACQSRLLLRM